MVHMDSINEEFESTGEFASTAALDTNNIILHPFAHQVGGHTQLLTLDRSTLCKPLIPRELLFYLNVPTELTNFVPTYKGVVQIKETSQGKFPSVVHQPLRKSVADLCDTPLELRVNLRPCSDEKILKKNLSQDNLLRADYISRPNDRYLLLLENVASKYQLPCILDLKMGTRQHGDDATEEKRHRQMAKCQASTSASLGVRLCGMQVYQVDYGGFLWYDKYYGRRMDVDGLKQALHQYFRNGSRLNEDIIDDVIDRLKSLRSAVEKSPSFRFYGTSLLIIHEGCTSRSKTKPCPVDVRLIDFAHTICNYNYTNGRSSSSPCVLRSSSAEQLSLSTPANHDNPAAAREKLEADNDKSPLRLQPDSQTAAAVNAATSLPPKQPEAVQQQQLAGKQSQLRAQQPIQAPTLKPCPIDLENHHPSRQSAAQQQLHQVITTTSSSESQNMSETTMIKCSLSEQHDNSAESARDTSDQKKFMMKDDAGSAGCDPSICIGTNNQTTDTTKTSATSGISSDRDNAQANSTINNNNNNTTNCRQINSTPTTPPFLGNRKVSKTSIGPDKGLLFGLENLMRLLDDLKSETLITCQ